MIRMPQSKDPVWYDLGLGVRLKVRPITTAIVRAASAAATGTDYPEADVLSVRMAVFNREIAIRSVVDWEGVGDADGNPAPVTTETIGAAMDMHQVDAAFQAICLAPWLMMAAEKKGSAPLPDGSSERAPTIAETATGSAPTAQAS